MKTIDIISATYGNLPIVKECLETWFPLRTNWKAHVYDSKASELDGTKEYLHSRKNELGFNLIDDGRILTHSQAIEELLKYSTADWVLHLDSDVKVLDKGVFEWIENTINTTSNKVFGRIDDRHFSPHFDHYAKDGNYRFCLPRTASWILLFERKFINDHKLSFGNMDLRFSATPSTNIMNLAIAHKVDPKTGQIVAPTTLNVLADVSWQLFWESYRYEVFEKIPKDIWDKFDHKHGGSRKWHADNRDALNNMRLELKKSAQNI